MENKQNWAEKLIFQFNTPRYVHVKSRGLGLMRRVIQLIILAYIIGFAIIYRKGYQTTGYVQSAVVTKIKGVAFTNFSDSELGVANPELYRRVWDSSDYIAPPEGGEDGGFFIMTNVVITPNQTRGYCPGDPSVLKSRCVQNSDCETRSAHTRNNGVRTGRCVDSNSTEYPNVKTCEIYSWCPIEQDNILPLNNTKALLDDSRDFTVLIKNTISFPLFGPNFQRRNVLEIAKPDYLSNCTYDKKENRFCPVFRIGDIVGDENFTTVAVKGGVFMIRIDWNCNLDLNFLENCRPVYTFARMDKPDAVLSPGFNFRYAEYQDENRRTLYKKYGLKFIVNVRGRAGKFSVIPLLLNIGSGLGLLGLAQIFCDLIIARIILKKEKRREIKDRKYRNVNAEDDNNQGEADHNNSPDSKAENKTLCCV